jgi:hypothetical protein
MASVPIQDASVDIKMPRIVTLDYLVGLRAWGLLLYGALPATLALLGLLEVKLTQTRNILLLIPISFLPLFLTFLLVRSRHREWYLTTDFLNFRSAFVTVSIISMATLISGLSGVLHDKYQFSSSVITKAGILEYLYVVAESFLLGAGSLVLTSTLFMAIITKGGDLPGLPASELVKKIATIRSKLQRVNSAPLWNTPMGDSRKNEAEELKSLLDEASGLAGIVVTRSFELAKTAVDYYLEAVETIDSVNGDNAKRENWAPYFASTETLTPAQRSERSANVKAYTTLQQLRGLKLGV